jgi:EAL domain-containing protein (putative c-di-GMP-specific phosphodiesterase class I)
MLYFCLYCLKVVYFIELFSNYSIMVHFGSAFANLCRVLKITPKIVKIESAFLSGK